MAYVFSSSASPAFGRRLGVRRKGVDWRVVALTAMGAVLLIAMLARPF